MLVFRRLKRTTLGDGPELRRDDGRPRRDGRAVLRAGYDTAQGRELGRFVRPREGSVGLVIQAGSPSHGGTISTQNH